MDHFFSVTFVSVCFVAVDLIKALTTSFLSLKMKTDTCKISEVGFIESSQIQRMTFIKVASK